MTPLDWQAWEIHAKAEIEPMRVWACQTLASNVRIVHTPSDPRPWLFLDPYKPTRTKES